VNAKSPSIISRQRSATFDKPVKYPLLLLLFFFFALIIISFYTLVLIYLILYVLYLMVKRYERGNGLVVKNGIVYVSDEDSPNYPLTAASLDGENKLN
jgi:hypothetical protein